MTIAYTDAGREAFPLVMLPGWNQTAKVFVGQVEGLAPAHRVIAIDHRGQGASQKPGHGYRMARLATDLLNVVDSLGLERFDLLGWSMGASVSWCFMDLFGTDRVRTFVSVDQPASIAARPWMTEGERERLGADVTVQDILDRCAALLGADGVEVRERFARGMFAGDVAPEVWDLVRRELTTVPIDASVALLMDHAFANWSDVLRRIDVPTLVLGCEGSHIPTASQHFVADQIPGARLHIFPPTVARSHLPFLENPEAFNFEVHSFISKYGRERAA